MVSISAFGYPKDMHLINGIHWLIYILVLMLVFTSKMNLMLIILENR